MEILKTPSFELAVNIEGDKDADHMALLIPGRLDTKDYANFTSHAKYLAERGFLTVAFDPPGTWESAGSIDLYTTTNYIKATEELIAYFGNKPTLLLGHSRGASVSMLVASNEMVKGIVLVMPNFGAPTPPDAESRNRGYYISYRDSPPGTTQSKEKKLFYLPMSYWDDGDHYDPIASLQQCAKPKLILYGITDQFVTPKEVHDIYSTLPEPKMMQEIESDHDYRYSEKAIEEVNETLGEFLEKYSLFS